MSTRLYICHCPKEECTGNQTLFNQLNKRLRSDLPKVHISGQAANDCYGRYLERNGYTKGSNREYHKEGHPTITLAKASRQPDIKQGKPAKKGGSSNRIMADSKGGGVIY